MELDSKFDVVVVGTGLTESIIAGAVARIGKTVLHLDENDYYGSHWASFSFSQMLSWVNRHKESREEPEMSSIEVTETIFTDFTPVISNVECVSYLLNEEQATEGGDDEASEATRIASPLWTINKLKENDRKFGLDVTPRLLFARGPMVDILVKSNVHRYLDFKPVTRVLAYSKESGELLEVPCSRCDIFNSKSIDVIEKRLLMRFMSQCVDKNELDEDLKAHGDKPFVEYLQSKGFKQVLQNFIINAIAMVDPSTTTTEAVSSIKKFLESLGVYGNTPFLFTLYGSGELPQAFCRLCAVFGGTYCLKRRIESIITDPNSNKVTDVVVDGQKIECEFIVTSLSSTPKKLLKDAPVEKHISRAIFISNGTVLPPKVHEISLFRLPADQDLKCPVNVIEVGQAGHVAPSDLYIVYCWCLSVDNAKKDLLPVAKRLFDFTSSEKSAKPKLLWSCYYNQKFVDCTQLSVIPDSLYVTSPPSSELDYDFAITEARQIFAKMFPNEEFLPRAPDPDEIIMEDPQVENHNSEDAH